MLPRMKVAARIAICSFVSFAAACGGKGAGESASARAVAALLPPDTVVYARLASLDALVASARSTVTAVGGDAKAASREQLLGALQGMGGDTSQIDGSRAIGVALVAPKGTRPAGVVFVPVLDGAKYAASVKANGLDATVHGDYAVLPLGGEYTKPAAPSPLADAMPDGLLAVRVDVAKAAANLGVMINSGLDVAERQLAEAVRADNAGLDAEAVAEMYVDFAKTLLAAGTRLELVLDETAGRGRVSGTYTAKPGSALDGWSSPAVDLTPFAGALAGTSALQVVTVTDWAKLWPKLQPMMTALVDMYPPSLRQTMQKLMEVYPTVYGRLGPVMVGGCDFADGIRMDVHVAPPDAKALLAEVHTLMQRPELGELGLAFVAGGAKDDGGTSVREYQLTFDPSRLAKAFGDEARSDAMAKQMKTVFQAMFGSDGVPLRFAVADGRGTISVGKLPAAAANAPAPARGTWPAELQGTMDALSGCNPLLIERFDFAAILRGVGPLMPESERRNLPVVPAGAKAEFVFGGGVRGPEWRALLDIDLAGFGAMIQGSRPR
jgi:hypothetical protein